MYAPSARRGTSLLVVILLLISILLEQAIAGICPILGQLGGIRPMIVFLDIPLESPVTIDWLPVGFIFVVFYAIVNFPHSKAADNVPGSGGGNGSGSRNGSSGGNGSGSGAFSRGWAILGRWWLLLIFLLTGGGIYAGVSDFLPRTIRNGIDSFGARADLILPYPSGEVVHLQGSMIMLVFLILGWRLLINKAVRPLVTVPKPIIAAPPSPFPAEAALPARGRIAMRIPEPVEVKSPGGRPCVYVAMPAGFQHKHPSYPCVVDNGIRPKANIS